MLIPIHEDIRFRPSREAQAQLPISARSLGHRILAPGSVEGPRQLAKPKRHGMFQLFWCVTGQGWIQYDKQRYPIKPNDVAIYTSNDAHHFGCDSEWEFHWLTLDGPGLVDFFSHLPFKQQPQNAGPCPISLFKALHQALADTSKQGECHAAAIAIEICCRAANPSQNHNMQDRLIEQAEHLLQEHFQDCEWNINRLADELNIHRSKLSRRFLAAKGTSPSQYLQALRIQHAQQMLECSQLSIAKIAHACGFNDPDYFSRSFSKMLGVSPRQFRKSGLN